MCGLVGTAGVLAAKDEALIKRLLIFDTLRGLDSTGLASVRKDGQVVVAKAASHPFDLFETKRFATALSGYNSKAFIGHNRAATTGAKTNLNAHPFEFGSIVGAHNGTLERSCWKYLEEQLDEEFDVDSQALFAAIAKFGVEKTIKMIEEGRTSSTGAWALTWYDQSDDTMNFIRNKHRPLWLAYSEDFKQVFWASEWPMIYSAAEMSNVEYKLYADKSGYRFFQLPADTWFKLDMEELVAGSDKVPLKSVMELKGKEPKAVATTAYKPPFWDTTTKTTTGSATYSKPKKTAKNMTVFTFTVDSNDPFSSIMDQDELQGFVRHGCAWCEEPVDANKQGGILLEQHQSYICSDCTQISDNINKVYLIDDLFEYVYDNHQ